MYSGFLAVEGRHNKTSLIRVLESGGFNVKTVIWSRKAIHPTVETLQEQGSSKGPYVSEIYLGNYDVDESEMLNIRADAAKHLSDAGYVVDPSYGMVYFTLAIHGWKR